MKRSLKRTLRSGGRRQFLKALSTLGVSGSALQYMSKDALAKVTDNPKDEVPRLEALHHTNHEAIVAGEEKPQREPVYYTIPRAEWAVTEAAHNASQRLFSQVHRQFGTDCTGDGGLGYVTTAVTDRVNGHHREKSIVVRHITFNGDEPRVDFDRLRDSVPATVTGTVGEDRYEETVEDIPVTVEKREFSTMTDEGYHYNYDYSGKGTPCGAKVEVKYGGETSSNLFYADGTVTCPAYHDSHGFVMLTAAHVVDDNYENYESEDIYNPDHPEDGNGGSRGDTRNKQFTSQSTQCNSSSGRSHDSAISKFEDGHSYKFAADDGTYNDGWEAYGVLGWDKIKDGASLTKQGARTGINSGSTTCVDSNYNVFETDTYTNGGDSGGPRFTETYYESGTSFKSIAGILSYGASGGNLAGGPHIGNAESAMNVTI